MTTRRTAAVISFVAFTVCVFDLLVWEPRIPIKYYAENLAYWSSFFFFFLFLATSGWAKIKMFFDKPSYRMSLLGILGACAMVLTAHEVTKLITPPPLSFSKNLIISFFYISWILSDVINLVLDAKHDKKKAQSHKSSP